MNSHSSNPHSLRVSRTSFCYFIFHPQPQLLVGGLVAINLAFSHSYWVSIIIPTDELIFFRGVAQAPTSNDRSSRLAFDFPGAGELSYGLWHDVSGGHGGESSINGGQ